MKARKELVEDLTLQWKLLWSERLSDKVQAEDVSSKDYSSLRVQRGTVIKASRDYKAPIFKEILEEHLIENPERFLPPDNKVGGWGKFVKTEITNNKSQRKKEYQKTVENKQPVKANKSKHGWLHVK